MYVYIPCMGSYYKSYFLHTEFYRENFFILLVQYIQLQKLYIYKS